MKTFEIYTAKLDEAKKIFGGLDLLRPRQMRKIFNVGISTLDDACKQIGIEPLRNGAFGNARLYSREHVQRLISFFYEPEE